MNVPADLPRPISPAFGAPFGDEADLSDEDGESARRHSGIGQRLVQNVQPPEVMKVKKEKKIKPKDSESDTDAIAVTEKKERKKSIDREGDRGRKLKDVTNSPRRRPAPSIHSDSAGEGMWIHVSISGITDSLLADHGRSNGRLTPSDPRDSRPKTPVLRSPVRGTHANPEESPYLPTPLPSSVDSTPAVYTVSLPANDADAAAGGRERRTRKSVNYAEPKLNT